MQTQNSTKNDYWTPERKKAVCDMLLAARRAKAKPLAERFMGKVSKQDNGCWIWTGKVNREGYGIACIDHNRQSHARRLALQLFTGYESKAFLNIYDTCGNKACVNPEHLLTSALDMRFLMTKVIKLPNGCWHWVYGVNTGGYGAIKHEGKNVLAHRASYELSKGPIPEGLDLDHLCRNRACINPDHLEAVPPVVNVMRGFGVGVLNLQKTHCIRGHELTAENIYPPRTRSNPNYRICRLCNNINQQGYRDRKKAKRNTQTVVTTTLAIKPSET